MENEENTEVTTEENSNEEVEETNVDETSEETTPEVEVEKPTETPEARKARLERQLKQVNKKLGVEVETKVEEPSTSSNDLGEKAFLIANDIKGKGEYDLVQRLKKETGKDVESLLQTTYFQSELSKHRTDIATPEGTKRSINSSVDSVEYWLAKGEMPPVTEVKLRREYVNAKMKKETSKGHFYNS